MFHGQLNMSSWVTFGTFGIKFRTYKVTLTIREVLNPASYIHPLRAAAVCMNTSFKAEIMMEGFPLIKDKQQPRTVEQQAHIVIKEISRYH